MAFEPDISVFRPDRPGIRKVLGDLEAEIMELVWARPVGQGTTVRDIFEILYERRRIAYTTVMNTKAVGRAIHNSLATTKSCRTSRKRVT